MFHSLDEQRKFVRGMAPTAIGRMIQYTGALCGAAMVFGGLYFLVSLE